MDFFWIEIFNNFSNIFCWIYNCRQAFVSKTSDIRRKWTIIENQGTFPRKERVEKFCFFIEICYIAIFVKQWSIIGVFLLFKNTFKRDQLECFWVLFNLVTVLWWYFSLAASIAAFRQAWRYFKWPFKSKLLLLFRYYLNLAFFFLADESRWIFVITYYKLLRNKVAKNI